MTTTVHGYPRIGPNRELKRASESYWAGEIPAAELDTVASNLRRGVWETLRDAGVREIPSNTFSYYDHVLDTALLFGLVPERFATVADGADGLDAELRRYFTMARGAEDVAPLEMTKWFDTNYHYLVPELSPRTRPRLDSTKPMAEYTQARELGIETRPVVLGPLTLLLLAKPASEAPEGWRPVQLLADLLPCYAELFRQLAASGVQQVQLDEPILATDEGQAELAALERAYTELGEVTERPEILVSTYFGSIGPDALRILKHSRVERIGLDLVTAPEGVDDLAQVSGIGDKTLVAGVVDGRNVWRTDIARTMSTLGSLLGLVGDVTVSTSCSLLHVPIDVDAETGLPAELRERLAFARQKLDEVVLLGRALSAGDEEIAAELERARAVTDAGTPSSFTNRHVRERLEALGETATRGGQRRREENTTSPLPPLPTTTIGSFPQTTDVRKARADYRAGRIDQSEYELRMRSEIDRVIALQEDIGLDVLVHGEPERNDMVQYFAERMDGFVTTQHGWVQSYGSRCVRPPILYGDVSRSGPMTVDWITYAQSRTRKPVKGMLTGPVTMLAWSFVRDDQPLGETARQVALALRDEVSDLEQAGIRHVQVDEAALRELLPLRAEFRDAYLDWAVGAFRLATSGAAASTWIHTHMCYSEFGKIVGAIEELDADVTSVEAARSHMELVEDIAAAGYGRGIGPGVYDIHSPRAPGVEEIETALRSALRAVPPERLWANPDCGLKTRDYPEIEPALRNMVEAVRRVRDGLGS
ncbi:methionine synthase (B12-independent) [Haloactinospora alba]|uniref:5-methyltetrahydropteroyltriglutamate--homocysteine methyltransferase n=1 Tax=Haloactinospora alba TaxID=405555 RepID=A0A543NHB8_9ACTN|nr:5-methyltetrahydropteroyltriglutamate--homocysteine S-methyltransferase [Haloactinospora alba]TQN31221.1 methionine synthase (B12-independent) [Haloactinospora alba]